MTPTPHHATTTATTASQRVVASYPTYTAAEQAVDYLSDHHFPVEHVAIVGRGLHSYEQVTGRMTWVKAAGYQAGGGAILGALFGWILACSTWSIPWSPARCWPATGRSSARCSAWPPTP
jgi:hypothetical protein